MISMISSTSITSISGVVLMSTITSGSAPLDTTFIAIALASGSAARRCNRRLDDEIDFHDARPLAAEHHAADRFVAGPQVAADMHLRLRIEHGLLFQALDQVLVVGDAREAPENVTVAVHRDRDVLRLGLAHLVAFLRQIQR